MDGGIDRYTDNRIYMRHRERKRVRDMRKRKGMAHETQREEAGERHEKEKGGWHSRWIQQWEVAATLVD